MRKKRRTPPPSPRPRTQPSASSSAPRPTAIHSQGLERIHSRGRAAALAVCSMPHLFPCSPLAPREESGRPPCSGPEAMQRPCRGHSAEGCSAWWRCCSPLAQREGYGLPLAEREATLHKDNRSLEPGHAERKICAAFAASLSPPDGERAKSGNLRGGDAEKRGFAGWSPFAPRKGGCRLSLRERAVVAFRSAKGRSWALSQDACRFAGALS